MNKLERQKLRPSNKAAMLLQENSTHTQFETNNVANLS